MHATSRYTVSIFFGVLLALVGMFGLMAMFQSSTTQRPSSSVVPNRNNTVVGSANVATGSSVTSTDNGDQVLSLVKNDVHNITGVPIDQIQLVSQEPATWGSSAMGCEKPNTAYLPVEVPGYKIILKASNEQFEYHTNLDNSIVLCKDTRNQDQ